MASGIVGQPGLRCQWEPTEDGTAIKWNGEEKFYKSPEWMTYLIDTFLKPAAALASELASPCRAATTQSRLGTSRSTMS